MRSFSPLQLLQVTGICAIICSALVGASYLHAEWSGPSANPPSGNVSAPINTSGSIQFKEAGGRIGADQIVAFDRMRSGLYCDQQGDNCFSTAVPLCSGDNQALGWNGNNWVCNNIDSGETGVAPGGCVVQDHEYTSFGQTFTTDINLGNGGIGVLPYQGDRALFFYCGHYHTPQQKEVWCNNGSIVVTQYSSCVYTGGP